MRPGSKKNLSEKVRAEFCGLQRFFTVEKMLWEPRANGALEISHPVAMQLYPCCSTAIHTISGIKHSSLIRSGWVKPAAERWIAENLIREQGSEKARGSDTEWVLLRQTQPDSWVSHSSSFSLWEVSHVSWEKVSVLLQTYEKSSSKN